MRPVVKKPPRPADRPLHERPQQESPDTDTSTELRLTKGLLSKALSDRERLTAALVQQRKLHKEDVERHADELRQVRSWCSGRERGCGRVVGRRFSLSKTTNSGLLPVSSGLFCRCFENLIVRGQVENSEFESRRRSVPSAIDTQKMQNVCGL